MINSLLRFSFF